MPMRTKEEQKEYQRKWIRNRRQEWFKDKSCVGCGSIENLELDHIDPSTKIDSHIWSWSLSRRQEELEKCQVLCHECHLIKTKSQYSPRIHGTNAMYRRENCRCVECKNYMANVKRRWRNRTGKN